MESFDNIAQLRTNISEPQGFYTLYYRDNDGVEHVIADMLAENTYVKHDRPAVVYREPELLWNAEMGRVQQPWVDRWRDYHLYHWNLSQNKTRKNFASFLVDCYNCKIVSEAWVHAHYPNVVRVELPVNADRKNKLTEADKAVVTATIFKIKSMCHALRLKYPTMCRTHVWNQFADWLPDEFEHERDWDSDYQSE